MEGHILLFVFFFFLFRLSYADDASVMLKLSQSFTSVPLGWTGSNHCNWEGVKCDSSKRVASINLISKSLSGNLSTDIFNQLSSLQILSLQQNRISGTLPSLSDLKNLQEVYFDGNQFTSFPSRFLSNLPSLQILSLSNNPLSPWILPGDSLSEITSLQVFRASNTNMYGQIPDIFEALSSLQDLRLSHNNLTGPLPASLVGSAIQNLWINDQKSGLSSALDVLDGMSILTQAWLHNNEFTGPIPELSKCTQLVDLQLRGNQLTGLVPTSLMNLPKLANVSLQNNMLQGPIPIFGNGVQATLSPGNSFCSPDPGFCDSQVMVLIEIVGSIGYPMVLAESWKGNDACNDWDHVTCDSTKKFVTGVNFAKQGFEGTISPMFANLTSLTTLDLSDNKLYGKIPDSLLSLRQLKNFDVSSNNLTGKIPAFSKSVMVNTNNNPFIGTDIDTTPGAGSKEWEGLSGSYSLLLFVIIGIIVMLLVMVFLIYYVYAKKIRLNSFLGRVSGKGRIGLFDAGSATYSIETLQEVTSHFSSANILGKGGFGIVYKGVLQDGTQIAVKRMESDSLGNKGLSEFQAEIAVLSKVRHRHLVALLGFCVNGNERFIVYEYMPMGTLSQNLFEWKELRNSPLTWKQRLIIALDVARGIEYLHSLAQESFIHRDLKPSNILLDNEMRAKVSDFGLVRNAPHGNYSIETRLAGTFGYLAPEYAATGRVTTKVDVFAYGVVLMEIITGRRSIDESLPDEEMHLVTWFRRIVVDKHSLRKAIDPCMEIDEEMYKSICKVAKLAGHCTARESFQRPDMGHAVSVISPLVQQWKPVECTNDEDDAMNSAHLSLPQAMRKWLTGETLTMNERNHSQIATSRIVRT
ncbi:hypothetical protein V2J09_017589 [Rumex salicifolius]